MVASWKDISLDKIEIINAIEEDNKKAPTAEEIQNMRNSALNLGHKVGDFVSIVTGLDTSRSFAAIAEQAISLHNQQIALDKGKKMGFSEEAIKAQFRDDPNLTASVALDNLVNEATNGQVLTGSNKGLLVNKEPSLGRDFS